MDTLVFSVVLLAALLHATWNGMVKKYPNIAGDVTDCLSGDVNKDFSKMFKCIEDFCPVPDSLPLGEPLP